jgi:ribonucleotide reductase beta subunit family protein with ferritin-like domain
MAKILDENLFGVSQLIQSNSDWAIDLWKKGCLNNWMPQDIDMSKDIKEWKSNKISEDERLLVKRTLGLFAMGESLVSNSIQSVEYKYITDGGCRQYLLRKSFEECVDKDTEVLTETGWINISELKQGVKIAQYNDGVIDYVVPTKIHRYEHKGLMYHFHGPNVDFLVTPNHRVFYQSNSFDIVGQAQGFKQSDSLNFLSFSEISDYFCDINIKKINSTECKIDKVDYEGYTYCVSVPSSLFLIRRNGKRIITGNSLHNFTVAVCCEAYNLDVNEVAEAYKNIPTIKRKNEFIMKRLSSFDNNFDINTVEGKQLFLKNMITFYIIMEGIWFFSNFALIMALGRQNKLIGFYDQVKYTIRDESLHVDFGIGVINRIIRDYPEIYTEELKNEIIEIIKEGVDIEIAYSKDILPTGILGVNSDMLVEYMKYLCNFRTSAISLPPIYSQNKNPFPWLGETQDTIGMTAFFERKEKNYQNSGSLEDDL